MVKDLNSYSPMSFNILYFNSNRSKEDYSFQKDTFKLEIKLKEDIDLFKENYFLNQAFLMDIKNFKEDFDEKIMCEKELMNLYNPKNNNIFTSIAREYEKQKLQIIIPKLDKKEIRKKINETIERFNQTLKRPVKPRNFVISDLLE